MYRDARLDAKWHGGRMAGQRVGLGRSDATQVSVSEQGMRWEARIPNHQELGWPRDGTAGEGSGKRMV